MLYMKALILFFSIFFLDSVFFPGTKIYAQAVTDKSRASLSFPDLKRIGKIQPRAAASISSSILWIGGEVLDRDYASYHQYKKYLGPLGAKKIRIQSGWAKTEKQKGVYNFKWMDSIVDDAISQGVQPWIQISYGNPIYEGAGGIGLGEGLIKSDEGFAAWEKYVAALVSRYKNRVNEWEIWNEADLSFGGASQGDYMPIFMHTAPIVRKLQPDAFIIALALAHVDVMSHATNFLDTLKSNNQLNLVNAISIHGYPQNPDASLATLVKYKALLKTYSPDLQLWQGESGCPSSFGSSGALGNYPWTETSQAKWDIRRALLHIGNRVPFSLFTISEYTYNSTKQKGLNTKGILKTNLDLSIEYAKPAYYAYQNLTATFDADLVAENYEVVELKDSLKLTIATFKSKKSGKVLKAVWLSNAIPADTDTYENFSLPFNTDDFSGAPVYANTINGSVYSIEKNKIKKESDSTIITIPVYDAPVLIGDRSLIHFK